LRSPLVIRYLQPNFPHRKNNAWVGPATAARLYREGWGAYCPEKFPCQNILDQTDVRCRCSFSIRLTLMRCSLPVNISGHRRHDWSFHFVGSSIVTNVAPLRERRRWPQAFIFWHDLGGDRWFFEVASVLALAPVETGSRRQNAFLDVVNGSDRNPSLNGGLADGQPVAQ
jgi:hypothetical protein